MGAAFVSTGLLGLLLLHYLEGCQVLWKGQWKQSNSSTFCDETSEEKEKEFRENMFPALPGGVLHSHVPVCDAADLTHQGSDSTRSLRWDLLLPLSQLRRPRQP